MLGCPAIALQRSNQHYVQNTERIIRSIDHNGAAFGTKCDVIGMTYLHHLAISQAQTEGMKRLRMNSFFDGVNRHIRFLTQAGGDASAGGVPGHRPSARKAQATFLRAFLRLLL